MLISPSLSPMRMAVPIIKGLPDPHRGKVRDTYDLGDGYLLVVVSDAISIFDFVLNAMIPGKGIILMVLTHMVMTMLEAQGIPTHLVAAGAGIDPYLPAHLRGNPALQSRALIVRRLKMYPREFVFRDYFIKASTAFKGYDPTIGGTICGLVLPPGLRDGDKLPRTMSTPTTKAQVGHDMPVDSVDTAAEYPDGTELVRRAFKAVSEFTLTKRILELDAKGEAGIDESGRPTLGDEFGTGDCSRFVDYDEWVASRSMPEPKTPPSYDKQPIRAWGITLGLNDPERFNPENPRDIERVHEIELPANVNNAAVKRNRQLAVRLLDMSAEEYLQKHLGVTMRA